MTRGKEKPKKTDRRHVVIANAKTEQAVLRKLHKFILRSQGSLSSLALTVYFFSKNSTHGTP